MVRMLGIAVVVLLFAGTATAENRLAAKESFRRGMQHYNLAEYSEALADFKDAYRNYEDPSLLFNIAQCERQLDHKPEAIRGYKTYLAAASNAPNREEVKQMIAELEQATIKAREATSKPPAAVITPSNRGVEQRPNLFVDQRRSTTPTAASVDATSAARGVKPVYRRWWLWTIVGAAVGVAAVGLGVGLSESNPSAASASTSLGTIHPF